MVLFLISLPGFGIETRKTSDYSAWAGPVFLLLTILVFVLGIVAAVFPRRTSGTFKSAVVGQGAVAIIINLLDFSGLGGPRPPVGPLVLGVAALIVALLEIALGLSIRGSTSEASVAA
jgi:hypothetical protein